MSGDRAPIVLLLDTAEEARIRAAVRRKRAEEERQQHAGSGTDLPGAADWPSSPL